MPITIQPATLRYKKSNGTYQPVDCLKGDTGLKGDPGNGDMLAADFSTESKYKVGDYVQYNGSLYRFTQAHAAGAWNGAEVVHVALGDDVSDLLPTLERSPNIFEFTNTTDRTANSVGLTFESADTVTFNGTASSNTWLYLFGDTNSRGTRFKAGTYYVGFEVVSGSYSGGAVSYRWGPNTSTWFVGVNTSATDSALGIRLASGTAFTNCKIRFWVIKSNKTEKYIAHDYVTAIDDVARTKINEFVDFYDQTTVRPVIDNMTLGLAIGSYKGADGSSNSESTYAKTTLKIPEYVTNIEASDGYELRLYAWNKDTRVYTGLLLSTGVIAPLPDGGRGMRMKSINMDEWRTLYPGNRFEIVISRETGSADMTIADAKAAFVAYTNGKYIPPKIENGNVLVYTDNVKGTFANPHDTSKNCLMTLWIPVQENTLVTFHANYVPAAVPDGTKFYRDWEFRTFDANGTVMRSTAITRNSISNRCYIQPGEKYIQLNHGVCTLDNASSASLFNVLPSDCEYGQIWIETVNGVDYEGFRCIQSANVLGIAHKGASNIAPEETEPAYVLAKKLGFTIADGDLVLAGDGTPVLMHDVTINRTGRNVDGTTIENTTRVDSLTLEELQNYDFGIWKGTAFTGTKILSLEDFLALCNRIGMIPSIEVKQTVTFTENDLDVIIGLIRQYGHAKDIRINSGDVSYLTYLATELPGCEYSLLTQTITDTDVANAVVLKAIAPNVMIGANYSNITAEQVGKCVAASIPLRLWTIDDPVPLGYTLPNYVQAVVSNDINASQWIEEYNLSQY